MNNLNVMGSLIKVELAISAYRASPQVRSEAPAPPTLTAPERADVKSVSCAAVQACNGRVAFAAQIVFSLRATPDCDWPKLSFLRRHLKQMFRLGHCH